MDTPVHVLEASEQAPANLLLITDQSNQANTPEQPEPIVAPKTEAKIVFADKTALKAWVVNNDNEDKIQAAIKGMSHEVMDAGDKLEFGLCTRLALLCADYAAIHKTGSNADFFKECRRFVRKALYSGAEMSSNADKRATVEAMLLTACKAGRLLAHGHATKGYGATRARTGDMVTLEKNGPYRTLRICMPYDVVVPYEEHPVKRGSKTVTEMVANSNGYLTPLSPKRIHAQYEHIFNGKLLTQTGEVKREMSEQPKTKTKVDENGKPISVNIANAPETIQWAGNALKHLVKSNQHAPEDHVADLLDGLGFYLETVKVRELTEDSKLALMEFGLKWDALNSKLLDAEAHDDAQVGASV